MLRRCTCVAALMCAVSPVGAEAAADPRLPRFTKEVTLDVGFSPWRMVAGDLNGDRHPDVATANYGSDSVSVVFGGTGGFGVHVPYRTARDPTGIARTDLEGDGDPDLVTASGDRAGSISVLVNQGSGRFRRGRTSRSGVDDAYEVAVADLDRDGIPDLASAHDTATHLAVLLGRPGRRFRLRGTYRGPRATDVALGDLNGDRALDVVLTCRNGSVVIRLGAGDGTFGPERVYRSGRTPFGIELADLDADDKLDVAVANYGAASVSVFPGLGDGTLGAPATYRMGNRDDGDVDTVLIADFDRDGHLDIATPGHGGAAVRRGRGDGTFRRLRKVLRGGSVYAAGGAVADFNRDRWPDIVVAQSCLSDECVEFIRSDAYVFLNWSGRRAPPCAVPSLAAYQVPLRIARRHLRAAGCQLGRVGYGYSRWARRGEVIRQRPLRGAVLASGGRVDVVVSSAAGPDKSAVRAPGQPAYPPGFGA